MEKEEKQIESPEEEKPKYHPRPAWQVWGARVGIVIMIVSFILYCLHIANGGIK